MTAQASGPAVVRLARAADDAGIRALLRRSVLDGDIRLAFTREPSYAAGEALAGSRDTTVISERDGQVIAMGRCSVQPLCRNGGPVRVAYLGELRFDPKGPSALRGMRDGYARLAEAATAAGAEGFVTVISDDNLRARRVLEHGGRLGLPSYRAIAQLVTLALPISAAARGAARVATPGASRAGSPAPSGGADAAPPRHDADELTAFLAAESRRAHLALAWDESRWQALAAHGIGVSDACVVRRDGRIVAAALLWDQRPFRQTVVDGYSRRMASSRPLVNLWGRLSGGPVLPRPGASLAQGSVLAPHVADPANRADWAALWTLLRARAAARGIAWLMCTRDERDPAWAAMRGVVRAREYRTTLYDVSWKDRPSWRVPWDLRVFRPEVGLL